jgi:HK97 family phage major capsid protein
MVYNNVVSRTDAAALIPEEVARDIIGRLPVQSAALTMFNRIPVSRAQLRIPILSALPTAYWVTGDTGLKQTSEVNWANKYLNIEELAVIVPIPQAVLDDADYDIWGESRPLIVEAIGRALDAAIFFGVNAPASFPANVNTAAAAAGNAVTEAAVATAGGFFGDIDATIATVETDGFDVSGFVTARSARGRFRSARNAQGDRLDQARIGADLQSLDGAPVMYPMRGLFPAGGAAGTSVRLFAGDFSQFMLGVRQDITFTMTSEGVIQDNTGAILFNTFQQDMVAMRVVFRAGWQVSNVINFDQSTEASRYPVGVLRY